MPSSSNTSMKSCQCEEPMGISIVFSVLSSLSAGFNAEFTYKNPDNPPTTTIAAMLR